MKINHFLLTILTCLFFIACSKHQDTEPQAPVTDEPTTINGENFNPTESKVKSLNGKLIISLIDGSKKIEIVTNDTIAGTYNIVSNSLKSASILQANVSYFDGINTFIATAGSGVVTINKSGTGSFSGTYNGTILVNNIAVKISAGNFANIAPIKLIKTTAAINDSLLLCYTKFHDFIEFEFLFDALYANRVQSPNSSWNEIYNHSQTAANDKVLMLWSKGFDIIYKLNVILLSTEVVISDNVSRNTIDVQAKAIRSALNYYLLTWFGSIPVGSEISPLTTLQSTKAEVWAQIKSDATDAAAILPQSWTTTDNFRIPKSFAQGILARADLNTANYNEAISVTQQITNNGIFTLSSNPGDFTKGNSEIFWGFEKGTNAEFNSFFTKGSFVPGLRMTETNLISIESQLRSGVITTAISQLNVLKTRQGEANIVTLNVSEVLQQLIKELDLEGSVFINTLRFNGGKSILEIPEYRLLLPIPISKIEGIGGNRSLAQNPGY